MAIETSPPDSSKVSMHHEEKGSTAFIEAANDILPFDEKAQRRLVRKCDLYLLPFFALLYLYVFGWLTTFGVSY
jgi:hypothetical protein